ncbi:MAG: aminopeptidase [Hydrogenophaga sp.]
MSRSRVTRRRPAVLLLCAVVWLVLPGCTSRLTGPGYYWQSITGHLALMNAARPLDDWLHDPATPGPLRERLQTAREIRRYAADVLQLPDNASYTRYADLGRRAAVYNVVAAPEFSLQLRQWCFPVTGCIGYRGYFDEADAQDYAAWLASEGEVAIYPVPAYSTLGWTNWLGGDPLLNTFIGYPEGELARLIFHELAHQQLYVRDDTSFNESFATAVERLGGARWLRERASDDARQAFDQFQQRRLAFRELTSHTRAQLAALYDTPGLADAGRRARKAAIMDGFRASYAQLRERWGSWPGYDRWVAQANNALFGAQAAYDEWVPAFEALFEREGRDFARFYTAARQLAGLPAEERKAALTALLPGG